jgi:hypothetical protein
MHVSHHPQIRLEPLTARRLLMTRLIDRLFLEHPRSAGQGYLEHMRFAHSFGARMLAGALAAFVHGIFPRVCETTASDAVRALHASLPRRDTGSA